MVPWKKRYVDLLTWGVVYSPAKTEQALRELLDWDCGDDEERAALKAYFHEQRTAHQAAQASWVGATDNDRLEHAFHSLEADGLLTLHAAGANQDEGWQLVHSHMDRSLTRGAVFYTQKDAARAMDGEGLILCHGAFDDDPVATRSLGNEVTDALASHGFQVRWAATSRARIELLGFRWQRRKPTDSRYG